MSCSLVKGVLLTVKMVMKLKNQSPVPKEAVEPLKKSDRGVKLTTYLQLVPKSRKCGSIHALPHTLSWHSV
jgi:hypothetical protein